MCLMSRRGRQCDFRNMLRTIKKKARPFDLLVALFVPSGFLRQLNF